MWFGFWVLKLAFTGLVLLGSLSHKSCILPCRLHNKGVVSLQNLRTADTVFRTLWYDAQSHICTHVIFSFVKDFSSQFVVGTWCIFFTYTSWWLHSLTCRVFFWVLELLGITCDFSFLLFDLQNCKKLAICLQQLTLFVFVFGNHLAIVSKGKMHHCRLISWSLQ